MSDQEQILKYRLRELIAGRKVKAALFYTFNFDPKFFENYVMPLLVPQQTFINNSITNNILWRKLYKDNLVPPVTVYFDQDAKNTDNGPYLDYNLVPVNMPMVGKNKGSFHPKHSFILVENADRTTELIVISGSNNISQSGWCENIECISEHVLINGKEFPYEFRKSIKEFIENAFKDFGKSWTAAEESVLNYLKKIGYTKERDFIFYNSYLCSFQEFLNENVLIDDSINLLEIISPFFSPKPELLNTIKENNIKIRIQAPFKDNYCLLDEKVYEEYKFSDVRWFFPNDNIRKTHSKVYRFFGAEKVYTIIGSVNLTAPAWRGNEGRSKQIYNIESAVLYIQKEEKPVHLFKKEIKEEKLKFIQNESSKEEWHERIEIPEINFTVNWNNKTLSWKSKVKNECLLKLSASEVFSIQGNGTVELSELKNGNAIIDSIARKPILMVTEKLNGTEQIHYYYANQIGFESRPLEFRLSATDIIDAWELLGNENSELNDWLINRLELATDLLQDESGKLISDKTANKSLLNEMARHFYGLVKLEEFLSDEKVYKKNNGLQAVHLNNIRYYLIYDNVDTLYSYFKDLCKLHDEKSIMSVYYWLILNIIISNFYENKYLWKLIKSLWSDNIDKTELKKNVETIINEIKLEILKVENEFNLDRKKIKWALTILQNSYGVSR